MGCTVTLPFGGGRQWRKLIDADATLSEQQTCC